MRVNKGAIAELQVALTAMKSGWAASKPMTEERYDLVLDDGQKLYRCQVKYAESFQSKNANVISVDLRRQCRNNGYYRLYTATEIDCVLVFAPKTQKIYWLPPEVFANKTHVNLRLTTTKHALKFYMAKDFEWFPTAPKL